MESGHPRISFVIPVYNEEAVLDQFRARMDATLVALDDTAEVILVNDGSRDRSLTILHRMEEEDPRYRVLNLSRNFGHQIAITAGIDHALGQAVVIMDADLQDPPEVALQMIETWRQGFQVVSARRVSRAGETAFKRASASIFYRLLRRMTSVDIPSDVGDFRLLDRRVVDALRAMPERDRYFRGMVSWVGFRQALVPFERDERAAGETKYPFGSMLRLAMNGVLGFSDVPLRLALWFGLIVSAGAVGYGLFVLAGWLTSAQLIPGWTSTVLILSLLGGIQLLVLGIIGLYVGRIHNEVKQRPLYFVDPRQSVTQASVRSHETADAAAYRSAAAGARGEAGRAPSP